MIKSDLDFEDKFKLLVIGETSTGKTSFIHRYVTDQFPLNCKPTIGFDFRKKIVHFDKGKSYQVMLWDIAGQERFGGMTRNYYKGAVGCLILFNLSDYSTFQSVKRWKNDLDNNLELIDGSPIPTILVGNKSDQPRDSRITKIAIDETLRSANFTSYLEASTKLDVNVNESVDLLIKEILVRKTEGLLKFSSGKSNSNTGDSIKLRDGNFEKSERCWIFNLHTYAYEFLFSHKNT